jgi:hypothetical protein
MRFIELPPQQRILLKQFASRRMTAIAVLVRCWPTWCNEWLHVSSGTFHHLVLLTTATR